MTTYEAWEQTVPLAISADPLWKMKVYRLALFASDIGWHDVSKLMSDQRTLKLSAQLYEALGSVSANIAEGYSRSSHRDQARMYEYALGSARESRDWYYKARHILGETVTEHRLDLITSVIRMLMVIVPSERGKTLRESELAYEAEVE